MMSVHKQIFGGGDLARLVQRDIKEFGQRHGVFIHRIGLTHPQQVTEPGIADAVTFKLHIIADRRQQPVQLASPTRMAWPIRYSSLNSHSISNSRTLALSL